MDIENLICKCPLCITFHTAKYYCKNIKNIIKIHISSKSKYIPEK